ncbi:methyl-accepting chemotaxis protein [Crenothrix polyspora]|uniref:Putative methyl-accepting chemotaxis AlkN n=1 Tax=Crenothrix polyspora TaxID=360316 RepID=A0A1R4HE70_9GAMM|nr:HAMP domain-containing methyl-accepting chemotaxis protein [Crenothrix polyspora]SJM94548.1 putative methyl-accepting chemotaxis AlkN [Crenothrix polyspora]
MKHDNTNLFTGLSLGQKLLLLCVVATIPVLMPLYLYYSGQEKYIVITETEQVGLQPATNALQVLNDVQKHRDLAFAALSGNEKAATERQQAKLRVDEKIAKFDKLAANFNYPGLAAAWLAFKEEWAKQTISIESKTVTAEKSWEIQTQLVQQIFAVQDSILAGSTMDLDPDAETYYLIQTVMVNTPATAEAMAQTRHVGAGILANDTARSEGITQQDRLLLSTFISKTDDLTKTSKNYIERSVKNFPELKTRIYAKTQEAIAATEQTNKLTATELVNAKTATYSAQNYLSQYNTAIDQQFAFISSGIDSINKEFDRQIKATRTALYTTFFITLAVIGLVFLIATIFARYISKSLTNPITYLVNVMDKMAGGDTKIRANIQSFDEIGALGRQFDMMIDQRELVNNKITQENDLLNNSVIDLLQTVARLAQKDLTIRAVVAEDITGPVSDALNMLADETGKVLSKVTKIAANVSNVSRQIQSQSSVVISVSSDEKREVEQASQELNDASKAMLDIAQSALSCNEAAEKAINNTNKAQATVLSTVQGITAIRDTIRETEKRIKRLGERSQEIGGIVNLINDIAERTHILALNASMHAASAGEAGRGFAVIANEVQKLAENSRDATSKISGLVNNIQVETADTVTTMNDAISQVVRGTDLAQKAGEEMRETRDTTANLVQLVNRIAASSTQQSQTSLRLVERAHTIQKSSAQTYDQLQAQGIETDRLVELSKELVASVSVFTLSK